MTRSYLPNDAELKIEQGIARYHVQRPLGMGGFAMTYCAVDTSLERNIAIKEFFPDGCTRKGRNLEPTGDWTMEILGRYVESFNNEGKTLASLQHSNIVQVYDRFLENRTAYIVLEYIEGRTLRQVWTERRAPFPLDEAMNIFRQIAGALSYMHTKKVLHRDLNYNNVMLKPNNQAILIDFGLARKFGSSQINTYTPAFFEGFSAPEEYDYPSSQPHERRDVYGLSALLYWMLTGSAPTSALLRRGNHPLSPPHEKVSTISHDLSMVVMKGLALREQERYQTIAEFEEALDATETTPPAVIPPQRPVYRQIPVPSLPPKLSHNPKDGAELVLIRGGKFLMGDDDMTNNPRHTVELTDYYIYKNLVTVEQYAGYCKAAGKEMPHVPYFNENWQKRDHPIVNVTWHEARDYANWAGGDLPSEAQWERAARGTDGRQYPWGDAFDSSKCWCSKKKWRDAGGTTAVGHYGVSPEGCTDMAGNAWQWCLDGYNRDFWSSTASKVVNPVNESVKDVRVLRGGSWGGYYPGNFRCACRGSDSDPSVRIVNIGFRVVVRVVL